MQNFNKKGGVALGDSIPDRHHLIFIIVDEARISRIVYSVY